MELFRNKKKGVPPHTQYPEILHWKDGDRINCWNIAQALTGEKFDWGAVGWAAGCSEISASTGIVGKIAKWLS